jgi:T-complex protein 1 subunit gamma
MWGINGNTGKIEDMTKANIWDPISVKTQTYKTAIESACMLLRIDDIISGIRKETAKGGRKAEDSDDGETMGDERDG